MSKDIYSKTVIGLQIRLINSLDSKLLSVLQVTTYNKGRNTGRVDRKTITDTKTKLKMAKNLKLDGKAKPIRRVWIPKPGKVEKRPLGIPTIMDRAKQQLALLALEPEWEAVFEPNSYGFRKGRSCQDAIEAIFLNLRYNRFKYVFDADIRKCFDRIDHTALLRKLNTFPAMERQVEAWLKAGIMEVYANIPKEYSLVPKNNMGTPQGGIVSPLLANIALHGLEENLKIFCANKVDVNIYNTKTRGAERRSMACGVIRYADDFVVIHENKKVMELCIAEVKQWLSTMGLEISDEKSKLRDSHEGFKFLGFQIIQVKRGKQINQPYKVKIVPSKENCFRFYEKVRKVIRIGRAWSSYDLIRVLRPIVLGWANYYRFVECKDVFSKIDFMIFGMIRAWVFRRDTRNGRLKIKEKYFPSGRTYKFQGRTYKDNWILTGKAKNKKGIIVENYLPRLQWVQSSKHVKINSNKSPFDGDHIYLGKRLAKYSGLSSDMVKLMKIQQFKCTCCGDFFRQGDILEIDHKIPKFKGGKDEYDNLQVLHKICHVNKTRQDNTPIIRLPKSKLMDDLSTEQIQDFADSNNIVEGF
jgi:RNA-directed DNA polymerase